MQASEYNYVLTPESGELRNANGDVFDTLRKNNWYFDAYTESNMRQVERDFCKGKWRINGKFIEENDKLLGIINEYPLFEKYIPYHHQGLNGTFVYNLMENNGTLYKTDNSFMMNLEVNENQLRLVTTHKFIAIYFPAIQDYIIIPGRLRTTFVLTDQGMRLESIESTNSLLNSLATNLLKNITVENFDKNIFENLINAAKSQESLLSLYEWYRYQSTFLLEKDIKDRIDNSTYKDTIQNLLNELTQFFTQNPSLEKIFNHDEVFMHNVSVLEDFIVASINLEFIGDGRKGDPSAEKLDQFDSIHTLLQSIQNPVLSLKLLEKTFHAIINNTDNAYTHTGHGTDLTSTQKKHIKHLQKTFLSITEKWHNNESVIKIALQKEGLMDYDTGISLFKKKPKSTLDKLLEKIQMDMKHTSDHFMDNPELNAYLNEMLTKKSLSQLKKSFSEAIQLLDYKELKDSLFTFFEDIIAGFSIEIKIPDQEILIQFINQINQEVKNTGDSLNYARICIEFGQKNASTKNFFDLLGQAWDWKFSRKGKVEGNEKENLEILIHGITHETLCNAVLKKFNQINEEGRLHRFHPHSSQICNLSADEKILLISRFVNTLNVALIEHKEGFKKNDYIKLCSHEAFTGTFIEHLKDVSFPKEGYHHTQNNLNTSIVDIHLELQKS